VFRRARQQFEGGPLADEQFERLAGLVPVDQENQPRPEIFEKDVQAGEVAAS